MLHSLVMFNCTSQFGGFSGRFSDFDKGSEPRHRIKELSGEGHSPSLALSQAETGRGAPLAADALF